VSDVSYDDVDLVEIDKLIALCFTIDVLPYLLGPRPIILSEPRLIAEGGQMVPADRVFLARLIRDQFGRGVAAACMDHHPIFRLN
jgi:hypothetical protein